MKAFLRSFIAACLGGAGLAMLLACPSCGAADQDAGLQARFKELLEQYPNADANKDGVLTIDEATAYRDKMKRSMAGDAAQWKGNRVPLTDSWDKIPPQELTSSASCRRSYSPVIVTGQKVSGLRGINPKHLVAFRFAGKWHQIPVQVDERAVVECFDIYNRNKGAARGQGVYLLRGPSLKNLVYTDANTFTGADPDAGLDDDDEVVFMFKDAGQKPSQFTEPEGVEKGSGVEIEMADPLTDRKHYVYLFQSNGKLDPAAGRKYVTYKFKLKAGSYKDHWIVGGARGLDLRPKSPHGYKNPEDSNVSSAFYTRHFSAKVICDGLTIKPPFGTDVNILDMRKVLFAPGNSGRSVLTFTQGEGAIIANINGPVRAIRSCIGANSGPLTQFDWFFYERREDVVNRLRVHPISSVVVFTDYSPAAKGMTYRNNLNPDGVIIDGTADSVKTGALWWEMVYGKQGCMAMLHRIVTNVRIRVTSYYNDDKNTTVRQVSGDQHAYGSSGTWIQGGIGNTDPRQIGALELTASKIYFYGLEKPTPDMARRHLAEEIKPLIVNTRPAR